MARQKTTVLTDRESEIMTVLWEIGPATADEIRVKLSGKPHDSTVRTLLRVLVSKEQVVATTDSRPTVFRPCVRRRTVQKKATRDLLKRFFGGSAEELVQQLLEDDRLSPEQLKELQAQYRKRLEEDKS